MIDLNLTLISLYNPLLMWIGYIILSKRKQKWYTFLLLLAITLLINYYLYIFIGPLATLVNFFMMTGLTTFLDLNWKRNFYLLTISVIVTIFVYSWLHFLMTLTSPTFTLTTSTVIKMFVTIVIFALLGRFFGKIQTLDFVTNPNHEYSNVFTSIVVIILGAYYWTYLLPYFLNLQCSSSIALQLLHVTTLTFSISAILVIISSVINKSIKLNFSNHHLRLARSKLERAQKEYIELAQKVEEKEGYIKHLDGQLLELGAYQERARKFEHDTCYMLSALNNARNAGEWEAFDELLETFKEEASSVMGSVPNLPMVSRLKGHKLFPIRQILLATAQKAAHLSIDFSVEVLQYIEDVGIPTLDLVRILTNWLSNAFEEVIHIENKSIYVSFLVMPEKDGTRGLFLRVTNSCRPELPFDISDLRVEGVSSKGTSRGYGLAIVEDIAGKFENVFVSTSKQKDQNQDIFIQTLEVVLD